MLLSNLQGAGNKLNSVKAIVNTLSIDLLIANETHLKKNDKFKLEGYKCFTRNRQDTAMDGIANNCAKIAFALKFVFF